MRPIAIFLPWLEFGGAERVMLNLARGLTERGCTVDLVLAKAMGGLLNQVPAPVRVIDLNSPQVFGALPGLIQYLKREKPIALLSGLPHVNLVALWAHRLARSSARIVISEHNAMSLNIAHSPRRKDKVIPFLARLFYSSADSIVAVSEGVAEDISVYLNIPLDRIHIIYNPTVSPEIFELAKQQPKHAWFESSHPPVILAAGRLNLQKDHATLLRAFALLRAKRTARLVILGEGELRLPLEQLASELGITHDLDMPGFVQNPYQYMARCSVFVLSSAWEGFGNVLTEALACGAQVVSTDCKSGPAEILDHGKFGRLVPVGDVTALAKAIDASLEAPFPVATLKNRSALFAVNTVTQQYLKVLLDSD